MIYYLKDLYARFLDFFDPDDYTYVVSDDTDPDTLAPASREHVRSLINFSL